MALIARKEVRQKRQLNVRLSLEVLDMLASYCRFIGGGKNYVVEECLRYTFGNDQSFREWLPHNRTTGEKEEGNQDTSRAHRIDG